MFTSNFDSFDSSTLPKTNILPLKMDGCKMSFLLGFSLFSEGIIVSIYCQILFQDAIIFPVWIKPYMNLPPWMLVVCNNLHP